jgi:hypothetical protein
MRSSSNLSHHRYCEYVKRLLIIGVRSANLRQKQEAQNGIRSHLSAWKTYNESIHIENINRYTVSMTHVLNSIVLETEMEHSTESCGSGP